MHPTNLHTHRLPILLAIGLTVFSVHFGLFAQSQYYRAMPASQNKKATVSEWIGITTVEITYNRPGVKGREGKIWGKVVHYGFADLGFGTSKAAPWRAGSEENTTISFSNDVMVEGKPLTAGKYGFFIAMGPDKATIIFSRNSTSWGSFYYDSKDDVLRVEVPVLKTQESVERLKYEFGDQTENSAVISLQWEKVKIPFTVSVDPVKEQIAEYRRVFNAGGFYRYWQNMNEAARYCLEKNTNLEEGLGWSERAVGGFFGEANFPTLSTYAGLLEKNGQKAKADSVMNAALPKATPRQLYSYAGSLMRQKRFKDAYGIVKPNFDKTPEDITAMFYMMKCTFGVGNKSEALALAEKILAKVDDANSRAQMDKIISDIKGGKDINQ